MNTKQLPVFALRNVNVYHILIILLNILKKIKYRNVFMQLDNNIIKIKVHKQVTKLTWQRVSTVLSHATIQTVTDT